jgi:cyanophycin synthetase
MDGLGQLDAHDIRSEEQLYKVLRTQVDVVLPEGVAVLNAAVPALVEMAELSDGEVLFYAADPALLAAHREKGGRAVFLQGGMAMLAQGSSEMPGAQVDTVLARYAAAGVSGLSAETVLAAVATAWALNIPPELISAGLDTFQPLQA